MTSKTQSRNLCTRVTCRNEGLNPENYTRLKPIMLCFFNLDWHFVSFRVESLSTLILCMHDFFRENSKANIKHSSKMDLSFLASADR